MEDMVTDNNADELQAVHPRGHELVHGLSAGLLVRLILVLLCPWKC